MSSANTTSRGGGESIKDYIDHGHLFKIPFGGELKRKWASQNDYIEGYIIEETNSENGNQYDIELENNNTNKDNDSVIMDDDDDIYGDYSAKVEDKNCNTNEISSDDGEKENVNENTTTTPSMPETAVHDITASTSDASTTNNNGYFNITK
jgi:hypothetical protein